MATMPRSQLAGAIRAAALMDARAPKGEADGLAGMNIPSVAMGLGPMLLAQVGIL